MRRGPVSDRTGSGDAAADTGAHACAGTASRPAPWTWPASTGGTLPEDRPPDPYEGGSVVDGEIQVVGHAH